MALRVRGLILVISVFQFVAVAGQAYSQDVGADLGPHDVKLVFKARSPSIGTNPIVF